MTTLILTRWATLPVSPLFKCAAVHSHPPIEMLPTMPSSPSSSRLEVAQTLYQRIPGRGVCPAVIRQEVRTPEEPGRQRRGAVRFQEDQGCPHDLSTKLSISLPEGCRRPQQQAAAARGAHPRGE